MWTHPIGDEILEELWYRKEKNLVVQTVRELGFSEPVDELKDALQRLAEEGLVLAEPRIELTPAGEERARGIVRRHRLAEVLFAEVIGVDLPDAEASACEFEHMLTEPVVERVCTFMGHPPKCPHGLPIPQGQCCRRYDRKIEPLIERLADVQIGTDAMIAFIAPGSAARLTRLATLGIAAGSPIRLVQKKPAVVVRAGETSIALEDAIAREIYVRRKAG